VMRFLFIFDGKAYIVYEIYNTRFLERVNGRDGKKSMSDKQV
jgi:hypothetical protein